MKRKLFTAALAIVALGGAAANAANSTPVSKSTLVGVYYNPGSGCRLTSCEITNSGTVCASAPGQFYDLSSGGCNPGSEIPAPSGKLPL